MASPPLSELQGEGKGVSLTRLVVTPGMLLKIKEAIEENHRRWLDHQRPLKDQANMQ